MIIHSHVSLGSVSHFLGNLATCVTLYESNLNELHSKSRWKYPLFTLNRFACHNGSLQESYGGQNEWLVILLQWENLCYCVPPPPVKLPQIAICVDISSDSALFWLNFNQCCTIGLGGHTFPSDTDALLIIISVLLNSTWNSLSRDMIQLPTLASTQRVFSITR